MKILVEMYREGRFFIARDLLTKIADQGLTENEAVQNLKKGVADHCHSLLNLTPRALTCLAGYRGGQPCQERPCHLMI